MYGSWITHRGWLMTSSIKERIKLLAHGDDFYVLADQDYMREVLAKEV